ncbi:MAG TPA: urease accessory protein UreD [Methylibium sp.]|nr:urease accessory protein UreD [Methylibium sp.]
MSWHAALDLRYRRDGDRTLLAHRHDGPLRVLKSLYPESPAICHDVLVHPPGGIVGGDALAIDLRVAATAHALVTTPGATRFYRSAGATASQTLDARIEPGARLEWLPLETICHSGSQVENRLRFELAPGAEMMGWDLLALGLPASGAPFEAGRVDQTIELPGLWLERSRIDAVDDRRLLASPLGWGGDRLLATLWFATGTAMARPRIDALLDTARGLAADHALAHRSGCTSPDARLVVLRALAPHTEPARTLLTAVWRAWRELAWDLAPCAPRVWQT